MSSQPFAYSPNVFWFNPFAEGRIALGRAFTPVKHQLHLAADLASLPQFLCRENDIVLVPKRPSAAFLNGLKQHGFSVPEFVETPGSTLSLDNPALQKPLGRLRPWAWAPDSVEFLEPLFGQSAEHRTPEQRFNERTARLYAKGWSAELLRRLLRSPRHARLSGRWADQPWVCTEEEVGIEVLSVTDALEAVAAIRSRGHHKVVVKETHGLAGHNSIRLWEPELLETQRRWMQTALEHGRALVVEPWLERELDFSLQLEMEAEGLRLCGYTGMLTDLKGQFQANWAGPETGDSPPPEVFPLLGDRGDFSDLGEALMNLLENELRAAEYLGPVGIDAFVYREGTGNCRVKPVVEVNPRYTMGRLTLELMKHVCPGCRGTLRLVSRAQARAEGCRDFLAYARGLSQHFPLHRKTNAEPGLCAGAVCLNDPAAAQVCLAVFQVETTDNL